ncbi:glycosyltransferase family 2 protein [Bacillus paramycoides]|uniref:Glycosyltransferase family 2 protein n=1 Tax=Bacillus paramycoides TaxID=2026194 RepID=A0ABU6MWD1_9BACI|nr:glycosyltransferase family 2 protein [Bacillus paramycoides]MED0985368.1 glycosyltransferase family 2 protein [Bacillus paramycoides]MED1091721.1 glycosyltransferase family 2 protein [Bacillus paramycoides]MED1104401.1 glycosyltransferase family 2 protein [Bacillus paramycoides]MED1567178.1 glycosyltransferase family 2 protein [Bacillus paramycoides]
MIVKNEEQTISRCLDSVKDIVDEVIIVDTGSTDATKEIVKEYKSKIYDFKWIDDFSAARNFAFSKATKKYILWLDADDLIAEEDKKKFLQLKCTLDNSIDAVSMKYYLTFDVEGNPTFQLRRYRLVKREREFQWHGFVHEYLEVYGNLMDSDIGVTHKKEKVYTDRNLKIYEKHLADGKTLSPRDVYYYANECKDHRLWDVAIKFYSKFLDEGQGWFEDNIQACLKRAECYLELGKWKDSMHSCLQSFMYDTPRGEICCHLGHLFLQQNEYQKAIYWYRSAIEGTKPKDSPFIREDCYTWLPHIQLCICYDHIKEYEKAIYHNEQAAQFIPNHPAITHNREYFRNLLIKIILSQ